MTFPMRPRPRTYSADMRMAALRMHESEHDVVVLGPCPGCESWQLDYSSDVAEALGVVDLHDVVEHALQEHLAECVHLQLLL